jgi:hypothetical protein
MWGLVQALTLEPAGSVGCVDVNRILRTGIVIRIYCRNTWLRELWLGLHQ